MPPEAPDRDPIVGQSLSKLLLISALLMVLSLGWALYDEFYGLRPWKAYQQDFIVKYTAFLKKQKPKQEAAEKAIKTSPGYKDCRRRRTPCRSRWSRSFANSTLKRCWWTSAWP